MLIAQAPEDVLGYFEGEDLDFSPSRMEDPPNRDPVSHGLPKLEVLFMWAAN